MIRNPPEGAVLRVEELTGGNTMANGKDVTMTRIGVSEGAGEFNDLAQAGRRGAAESRGPAEGDFQQRQFLSMATDARRH